MNNAEAKFILQGYRPNGADAGDATFGAALAQAGRDPALGGWFQRQQAFDAAVSAKVSGITPPADLRAAILAGVRVTAATPQPRAWWNQPVWLAAAACLAVMFAAAAALWPKSAVALENFAVADAAETSAHGGHGHETGVLQAALSNPSTRLTESLPVDYATLRAQGCRMVRFQDRDVLEICFSRNGVWFHCYIARAEDFPRLAIGAAPTLIERGAMALATWRSGGNLLLVVSPSGLKNLESLL